MTAPRISKEGYFLVLFRFWPFAYVGYSNPILLSSRWPPSNPVGRQVSHTAHLRFINGRTGGSEVSKRHPWQRRQEGTLLPSRGRLCSTTWNSGGQAGHCLLTWNTIVKRVAGHQGTAVEVCREDKRLCLQPLHDGHSFRLPWYIVKFKSIGEISVQVIEVSILPLRERIF